MRRRYRVRGDWLTEDYQRNMSAPRWLGVEIEDSSGLMWWLDNGWPLSAERWPDGDYITNGVWIFSPDDGELERLGCQINTSGKAVKA